MNESERDQQAEEIAVPAKEMTVPARASSPGHAQDEFHIAIRSSEIPFEEETSAEAVEQEAWGAYREIEARYSEANRKLGQ